MLTRNIHWGSRIIIHNNHLYAGFGERGLGMIAQDPSKHPEALLELILMVPSLKIILTTQTNQIGCLKFIKLV